MATGTTSSQGGSSISSPTQLLERPKVSWVAQEYSRTPWVRVKLGKVILPPNEQLSNLHLTDDDVMRKRTEKVGTRSDANPIKGGDGGNSDSMPLFDAR